MYDIRISLPIWPYPAYWTNYIRSVTIEVNSDLSLHFYNTYKGKFYHAGGIIEPSDDKRGILVQGITFKNEEDATAFILKWS